MAVHAGLWICCSLSDHVTKNRGSWLYSTRVKGCFANVELVVILEL